MPALTGFPKPSVYFVDFAVTPNPSEVFSLRGFYFRFNVRS